MHEFLLKFTSDWGALLPQPYSNALLTMVAALCGALVGMEREKKDKPTGVRTLTLVSLGAAVFTMLSEQGRVVDGRIVAQIVSGVGFLGAGAIIHRGVTVGGMTSAATIWVTAALGTTAGFGYGGAALGVAFFTLGVLTLTTYMERGFLGHCHFSDLQLLCLVDGGKTIVKIERILADYPVALPVNVDNLEQEDDTFVVHLRYCSNHKVHREILVRLAEVPEVLEMHRGKALADLVAVEANSPAIGRG